MAKKKIPPGQVNQKNLRTLKALTNLMEDLDQKYSIKVGIIGDKATQNVPGTDLTMADLGAIHEFGATIKVTKAMRGYFYNKWGIQKSNKPVVIPTRSFLRMPLLSPEGQKALQEIMANFLSTDQEELNKLFVAEHPEILEKVANALALAGETRVLQAFQTSGFGNWPDITEFTRQRRKGDPSNPPLNDMGDLMESIASEVKKV